MKKTLLLCAFLYVKECRAFDTWWHAECTRKAMVANGFSGDARLATQVSNYFTDYLSVANDYMQEYVGDKLPIQTDGSFKFMHFDAIFSTADLERNWQLLFDNTVACLKKYNAPGATKPGFRLIVFYNIIGATLHIVQDFYSHSSWVNLYMAKKTSPIPTWYETTAEDRKAMKLATGAYPDGSKPGMKNHSDLNKDCSTRPLNKEAVEIAERASTDWVRRLMEAVPEAPWAELKAYNIQKDPVMKRFLVSLDATFLTSSSILPDHFDGKKPAKFVFAADKDPGREKRQAAAALALTLNQYDMNIRMPGNEGNLPSPYWAGFMIYRIVQDLAAGLRLNGTDYKPPQKKLKDFTPADE